MFGGLGALDLLEVMLAFYFVGIVSKALTYLTPFAWNVLSHSVVMAVMLSMS